ncbi:DUF6134 family protein [Hydrocarboniphaga sp.]|uniref:DUF6134 family protein n=1 Tax=Hydrocarboniphaga sp. TaxID=2033016 RepID=UPI003D14CBB6
MRNTEALLLLCAAMAPLAADGAADSWTPADGEHQHFRIIDGDKPVGELMLRFSRSGETLSVERQQTMSVSRMMIKATLTQTSKEQWSQDRLLGISTRTELKSTIKDESKSLQLSRAADGKLSGNSGKDAVSLPADALPLSLWNEAMTRDGRYFDPADGKLGTLQRKTGAIEDAAPAGTDTAACKPVELAITNAEKKTSRVLVWRSGSGKVCTMRFFSPMGTLDYVAAGD